jgi:hypothetical protein
LLIKVSFVSLPSWRCRDSLWVGQLGLHGKVPDHSTFSRNQQQGESDGREWCVYHTRAGKALERPINDASAEIARSLRAKVGSELFESAVAGMRSIRKALS